MTRPLASCCTRWSTPQWPAGLVISVRTERRDGPIAARRLSGRRQRCARSTGRYRPPADFLATRSIWRLLERTGTEIPVLSFDFVASVLEVFGDRSEAVAIADDGTRPLAMAILRRVSGVWSAFSRPKRRSAYGCKTLPSLWGRS
jgi:CelD/BcsL family acetyltransferase involved in cellulose biosynthesis